MAAMISASPIAATPISSRLSSLLRSALRGVRETRARPVRRFVLAAGPRAAGRRRVDGLRAMYSMPCWNVSRRVHLRSRRSYQQSSERADASISDLGDEREYQRPSPRALVQE